MSRTPEPVVVVFDTVVLSNFCASASIDLLVAQYGNSFSTTYEVLDEITRGIAAGYGFLKPVLNHVDNGDIEVIRLGSRERDLYLRLVLSLGPGEASCVAAAWKRGAIAATDDRAARNACTENAVKVTGTVGILKRLCITGSITEEQADGLLEHMVKAGFYSPVARIRDIMP